MQNLILEIPGLGDLFQFSEVNVMFLLIFVATIIGVWLCFGGYRYFKIMAFILIGCICGKFGYTWGILLAKNPIFQMYIFVACILGGIGLFYLISLIWDAFMQKNNKKIVLEKILVIVSPIFGAFVLGGLVYTKIYHNLTAAIVIGSVFMIAGILWGRANYESRRKFYTYDDLINVNVK